MRYFLVCDNCGWSKEANIIIYNKCPNCNYNLYIEDEYEDDNISEAIISENNLVAEKIAVEKMQGTIKDIGHERVWECIESFGNAMTRLSYRILFFKAGGRI